MVEISRRNFLTGTTAAGLILGQRSLVSGRRRITVQRQSVSLERLRAGT